MNRILLLGAGKIGRAIAKMLGHSESYEVVVGDVDQQALATLANVPQVTTRQLDVSKHDALLTAMQGCQSVLSALSFTANPAIARAALAAGCSYFDLTEDVATTRAVADIARAAKPGQIFMPQCGLAPGFISIAGHHVAKSFDTLDEVKLRVGALAQFPTGELKYNLTWSTEGLINEYCNPCEVIHDGKRIEVLPLEGLEHFSLDGVDYEAFNTSGGVGTLWETLHGRVRNLDYKTIRYRGHRDLMSFLVNELRLSERRDLLKDIMENAVPMTFQDVVLIFISVTGMKNGRFTQVTDARKIYHGERYGEMWSGIQITTAAGICTAVDLHHTGKLPNQGFVRQEAIDLDSLLANRFGCNYRSP
jgi:saccharopine dehydrogenase-like NADP-dependent oxidoreductase